MQSLSDCFHLRSAALLPRVNLTYTHKRIYTFTDNLLYWTVQKYVLILRATERAINLRSLIYRYFYNTSWHPLKTFFL